LAIRLFFNKITTQNIGTAKKVEEWLLYRVPNQLNTLPQSPDMNPIEHLWDEIGRRLKIIKFETKTNLKMQYLKYGTVLTLLLQQN